MRLGLWLWRLRREESRLSCSLRLQLGLLLLLWCPAWEPRKLRLKLRTTTGEPSSLGLQLGTSKPRRARKLRLRGKPGLLGHKSGGLRLLWWCWLLAILLVRLLQVRWLLLLLAWTATVGTAQEGIRRRKHSHDKHPSTHNTIQQNRNSNPNDKQAKSMLMLERERGKERENFRSGNSGTRRHAKPDRVLSHTLRQQGDDEVLRRRGVECEDLDG